MCDCRLAEQFAKVAKERDDLKKELEAQKEKNRRLLRQKEELLNRFLNYRPKPNVRLRDCEAELFRWVKEN